MKIGNMEIIAPSEFVIVQEGNTIMVKPKYKAFENKMILHHIHNDNMVIFWFTVSEKEGFKVHYSTDKQENDSTNYKFEDFRIATDEEINNFHEGLKRKGLFWCEDVYRVLPIFWREETNKSYYFCNDRIELSEKIDTRSDEDEARYASGNYFKTIDAAERAISSLRNNLKLQIHR